MRAYVGANVALVGEHPAAVRALIDLVKNAGSHSAGVSGRLALFEGHFRAGQEAGVFRSFDTGPVALALIAGLDAVVVKAAVAPPEPTIAEVKRGAEGAAAWAARWDSDARFRRGLRIDTAAWGAVLLANAVVHIVLVYTLPIDLISLVTTVVWFAAMACLIAWHVWYLRKEGLDA